MKKFIKTKSREKPKTVAVSGGFDPIHIGHVRMIQEAAALGDELIVILNNDNWLKQKKGFVFMNEKERKEIILGLRGVTEVFISKHKPDPKDMSVSKELKLIKPDIFAQGGDRKPNSVPSSEVIVCEEMGSRVVYNIGRGGKVQSSSFLVANSVKNAPCPCRSGKMYIKCGLITTKEHQRLLQKLLNG